MLDRKGELILAAVNLIIATSILVIFLTLIIIVRPCKVLVTCPCGRPGALLNIKADGVCFSCHSERLGGFELRFRIITERLLDAWWKDVFGILAGEHCCLFLQDLDAALTTDKPLAQLRPGSQRVIRFSGESLSGEMCWLLAAQVR